MTSANPVDNNNTIHSNPQPGAMMSLSSGTETAQEIMHAVQSMLDQATSELEAVTSSTSTTETSLAPRWVTGLYL